MDFINAFYNYFSRRTKGETATPEGLCPNCWGKQEYEGAFLEAVQKEQIDLNNVREKKGWIQAHAARYFEGIQLRPKTDDLFECPSCKLTYRPERK